MAIGGAEFSKCGQRKPEKLHSQAINSEIYPGAKGIPGSSVIFFISSRHVETIVLMSMVKK
jgi:hypothetical protein